MIGPTTALAYAVILGVVLAAGVLCIASVAPTWRAPSLERRVAPYLRDLTDPAGTTPVSTGMLAELIAAAGERFARLTSASDVLARRLSQAGLPLSVATFRAHQLAWAVAGLLLGGVLTVVLTLTGRGSPLLVVVPPVTAVLAVMLSEWRVQRAARRRLVRLQEELPSVLEFLSLCLAAGEGLLDAVRRVCAVGAGELSAELRRCVLEVDTGSSLGDALTRLARRIDLPALSRGLDQLVASIERGTPLARVLQAQADDAREEAKRLLIERAGRSEIAMLVPLVFLILPLSVIFAVYPGVYMLQLGLG